jgi:hypothetical protein
MRRPDLSCLDAPVVAELLLVAEPLEVVAEQSAVEVALAMVEEATAETAAETAEALSMWALVQLPT